MTIINKLIKNNDGQVALIVLIISAVVLSLGLSTSKKTVVDTKITTDEESMKKAFNNAESAIDYYLRTGNTSYTNLGGGDSATVTPNNLTSDSNHVMEYNEVTLANRTMFYWLVGHDASGNLNLSDYYSGSDINICVGSGFGGAVKVDYFYVAGGAYGVSRTGFNVSPDLVSGYSNSGTMSSCGPNRNVAGNISMGAGRTPLLVAVTPLRASARLAVQGTTNLPVQGEEISSTSVIGDQATGVRVTIKQLKRYELPTFMLEAITSESEIDAN